MLFRLEVYISSYGLILLFSAFDLRLQHIIIIPQTPTSVPPPMPDATISPIFMALSGWIFSLVDCVDCSAEDDFVTDDPVDLYVVVLEVEVKEDKKTEVRVVEVPVEVCPCVVVLAVEDELLDFVDGCAEVVVVVGEVIVVGFVVVFVVVVLVVVGVVLVVVLVGVVVLVVEVGVVVLVVVVVGVVVVVVVIVVVVEVDGVETVVVVIPVTSTVTVVESDFVPLKTWNVHWPSSALSTPFITSVPLSKIEYCPCVVPASTNSVPPGFTHFTSGTGLPSKAQCIVSV